MLVNVPEFPFWPTWCPAHCDVTVQSGKKPLVGISSCLLGERVRYDGRSKLNISLIRKISQQVNLFPVCAEAESGMGVPREPMDLFIVNTDVRMITLETRTDVTLIVEKWMENRLNELAKLNLCGFIFKAKSPSCALGSAKIYRENILYRDGTGVFAAAFMERFPHIPVEEETFLKNTQQRLQFFQRVNVKQSQLNLSADLPDV